MLFHGRSVVITGGARGIGFATARAFLDAGASVTIGARSEANLAQAREMLAAGERLATTAADVATVAGCDRLASAAIAAFGRIDVLFTNAGIYETLPIEEMTEDLWDRTIDTHLKGTFFSVKYALPSLRATNGVVITMGSDAGLLGLRGGWAAYCAAKGGIVNLTRQLAVDLAPGVRVNCIAPGPVGTEHLYADLSADRYGGFEGQRDPVEALVSTVPLRRIITPEEVAQTVLFVAGASSMTGAVISLDGGTTAGLP